MGFKEILVAVARSLISKEPIRITFGQTEEESTEINLNNVVPTKTIYIDTCSLMSPQIVPFLSSLEPILQRNNKKLIVLRSCIKELEKHKNGENEQKKQSAVLALDCLDKLNSSNSVKIDETARMSFADAEFISLFVKYRINQDILFITQDHGVAFDVLDLNESRSVDGNEIIVCKIDQTGHLEEYDEEDFDDDDDDDDGYDDDIVGIKRMNIPGDMNGDINGQLIGNIEGDMNGNIRGKMIGNIEGDMDGNINGELIGDILGDLNGNVGGVIRGNIQGDVNGNIKGKIYGKVYGNVNGRGASNIF